jgi:antitoxin VapB
VALNVKDPEADRLARELAPATGESPTEAVLTAIRERLQREAGRGDRQAVKDDLRRIQQHFVRGRGKARLTAEEIIGYDEQGLPT